MRSRHAAIVLAASLAACATPAQVRRVETQVAVADHDRARSDSAQRAELARIQIMLRQNADSMNAVYRQFTDLIQRMNRDNAASFLDLQQRFYQLSTMTNTTAASLNKLSTKVDLVASNGPPASATPDSTRGNVIQSPDVLIAQARQAMLQSAYPSARRSLMLVLTNYPQAPEVAEALYWLGNSFEGESPDSARAYYARVFTTYPKADKAPTALYKLGNLELKAGNLPAARKYWQQIVTDYKQSIEYELARTALRENP